ncbi:MAG: glycosyltransferase family 2 protein [Pseudomonadota bacterium]
MLEKSEQTRASFTVRDVTVVTVSYNSAEPLKAMLASLPTGTKAIIVDNSGQDNDALNALAQSPDTCLITNASNQGFGKACNRGGQAAETEFVLFLNPDTVARPGAIEALIASAERHGANTAFNPRIENSRQRPLFKRRSVLLPRSKWLRRGCPDVETEVPVLSGACIFVRKTTFEKVEFDPKIFMYHEDDDWSIRVSNLEDGKLVFVPDAIVTHASGHSSGRSPKIAEFKAFQLAKSRVYTMQKHGRFAPKLQAYLHLMTQFLNPQILWNRRKRAKAIGFMKGLIWADKDCSNPDDLPG